MQLEKEANGPERLRTSRVFLKEDISISGEFIYISRRTKEGSELFLNVWTTPARIIRTVNLGRLKLLISVMLWIKTSIRSRDL